MKRLPIGIQTFSKLIEENCLYIDKTKNIHNLLQTGSAFFLSRPRRFGKSLLVSTLKSIFSGEKEYFKELYIYDKIEWEKYPIIHIDFSLIDYNNGNVLEKSLKYFLDDINERFSLQINKDYDLKTYFGNIIRVLSEKNNKKVVVLIDEYDKPIIDHITDLEKANQNRLILRDFYGVLKGCDPYLKFLFITGVSKFAKVSVFSGLNNLWDITLDDRFSTMLGYTQEELEHYFDEGIDEFAKKESITKKESIEQLKKWYNGYSWNGVDKVYNPLSILRFFASLEFGNYWFETGTPSFLIDLIKDKKIKIYEIEKKEVGKYLLDAYEIDNIDIHSLLFQTGYLTIAKKNRKDEDIFYVLDYPNLEVRKSLLTYLTSSFIENTSPIEVFPLIKKLKYTLKDENIDGFIETIRSILSSIPYNLHIKKEAYYHSLFYMILKLMDCEVDLEVLTDKGRIDGVMRFDDKIYVMEFKMGVSKKALKQIKDRKYYERFLNEGKKIILLGVGFNEKEVEYLVESLT